jgi:hypothetical protein
MMALLVDVAELEVLVLVDEVPALLVDEVPALLVDEVPALLVLVLVVAPVALRYQFSLGSPRQAPTVTSLYPRFWAVVIM